MTMYNLRYYTRLTLYYCAVVVRGLLLVVFTPLAALFGTLESTVSEWEPNKPLHTTSEDDIDYDKHLGI
jgi:hypothetical protein